MKKTVLTYGLISGGISTVLLFGSSLYMRNSSMGDWENAEVYGYASILLSMLFVFLGVRAYRNEVEGGVISFGKAFKIGLYITLISCVMYVIAWMIVSSTILPDFMDQYAEFMLQKLRDSGASAEEISQETAKMEHYMELYKNPFLRAGITFLEPLPVGLLVTLASAGILRRS
jgi:hypothetical protein